MVTAVVVVAVASGLFAIGFREALFGAVAAVSGEGGVVAAMTAAPWWLRLAAPIVGALAAGTIVRFAVRGPGGVGAVMEAVALGRVRLSLRATLARAGATWCAIASGGSIGREAPLIQVGGALGKVVGQRFALDATDQRIAIAAGCAAGFTAAYNTPLAAILFVLEIVIGVFVIDAVVPIALATVIATVIARATGGGGPLYGQRAFALVSPVELLAFVGVGVAGALAGLAFVTALHATARALARIPQPWRAALGGAAVGAILIGVPAVAGNGFEPLADMLDERLAVATIAVLMIAKLAATTASVGSGSPGGVFTPILLIGGGAGALVAAGLAQLGAGPLAPAGGYALVGMAAATAATTHAPLMAAVLAFELSGDYAIALPLLVATATATALARAVDKRSLYTAELPAPHRWELTLDGRRGVEDLDRSG